MKKRLTAAARKALPAPAIRGVEEVYRRGKAHATNLRYGYPARTLRVIAVTGTDGKATTAAFVNEILKQAGMRTALYTTSLIEIDGIAKQSEPDDAAYTSARMQRFFRRAKQSNVDYVIVEVTSHTLHRHKLLGVPIETAIMTNLLESEHSDHGTMSDYARTKGRLFANKPSYIVLNTDDEWFDFFYKYEAEKQRITYGTDDHAEAQIQKVKLYRKGSEAQVIFDHQTEMTLTTALPGKENVYYMVAAATAAYALGVKLVDIVEGVANLEQAN